jgi:hypothetical protein
LDVERFDLEPQRRVLHGLLGDVELAELANLPSQDKVPYALRMMDGAAAVTADGASLVEVGTSLPRGRSVVGRSRQSRRAGRRSGQRSVSAKNCHPAGAHRSGTHLDENP